MSRTKNGKAAGILAALKAIEAPIQLEESGKKLDDLAMEIQDLPSRPTASMSGELARELSRIVLATAESPRGKKFADPVLAAMKMLALLGTREGTQTIIDVAARGFAAEEYLWSVVLGMFGEGHPGAETLFKSLSRKLPEKFLGISLLDAANSACREHGVKSHPFDNAAGEKRLAKLLSSTKAEEASYAVSACAALPFLSPSRRRALVALARKQKDEEIRMEVAWATAKLGDKDGLAYLVEKTLDCHYSDQACEYLKEIGKAKLIPKEARDPDFAAMSEMAGWLRHPNEYGEAATSIRMMDKRRIYWPPRKNEIDARLFAFEYAKSKHRPKKEVGVGMTGSMTWAMFDENKPTMKPEDIYGVHCCFELECEEDSRAPKKRSGKAGWELIKKRA